MRYCRLFFLLSILFLPGAGIGGEQRVAATIDATRTGQPISGFVFGGFMEPATTSVWAEMLTDRKFLNEINSKAPAAPAGWLSFLGPQRRWVPIGDDSYVTMDRKAPYVGEWSPLVRLETGTPHGISQSPISLVGGRRYSGRVILSGTPGIKKVIASGATPEEMSWTYIENRQLGSFSEREKVDDKVPFAFGTKYDWTGALLKHSADYIDFLGEHFYGYPNLVIDADKQAFVEASDPLEHRVRRMSNKVQFKFEAWEEYLKKMPALKEKSIRFAFDEWAPRNARVNQAAPAAPSNPMLNTLTDALVYHEFFRHSDMVALAVATGGMMTLANDVHGDAAGLRIDGLLMKLMHDHFAETLPVSVVGHSPQPTIKGTVAVDLSAHPSGSPTYPLDVFAALSADKKKLAISVINPTETAQEGDLSIRGVQPIGGAKLFQLAAPPGKPSAPAGFGPGMFGGPPAKMAESSLPQAPGRVTLPPASISVYEFAVK